MPQVRGGPIAKEIRILGLNGDGIISVLNFFFYLNFFKSIFILNKKKFSYHGQYCPTNNAHIEGYENIVNATFQSIRKRCQIT